LLVHLLTLGGWFLGVQKWPILIDKMTQMLSNHFKSLRES
jgi:hypothetical protein